MGQLLACHGPAVQGERGSRLGIVGEAWHQVEQLVPDDFGTLSDLADGVSAVTEAELVAGREGGMTLTGRH
jgi:hypothetical protein